MNTFIALLRGINVGGHRIIKMADLRERLSVAGYEKVKTYIQSGNIVFSSQEDRIQTHQQTLEKLIFDAYGFQVPVMVLRPDEIRTLVAADPYRNDERFAGLHIYYSVLVSKPDSESLAELETLDYPDEYFSCIDRCIYSVFPKGAGKAKLNNNIFEKKLGVSITTRNLKTMNALLALVDG